MLFYIVLLSLPFSIILHHNGYFAFDLAIKIMNFMLSSVGLKLVELVFTINLVVECPANDLH